MGVLLTNISDRAVERAEQDQTAYKMSVGMCLKTFESLPNEIKALKTLVLHLSREAMKEMSSQKK